MRVALIVCAAELTKVQPFPLEEDELEMYLEALQEELSQIEGVLGVKRTGMVFQIDTPDSTAPVDAQELIRPALIPDIMSRLRIASLIDDCSV